MVGAVAATDDGVHGRRQEASTRGDVEGEGVGGGAEGKWAGARGRAVREGSGVG
jgi:hypothetical protein